MTVKPEQFFVEFRAQVNAKCGYIRLGIGDHWAIRPADYRLSYSDLAMAGVVKENKMRRSGRGEILQRLKETI